PNRGADGPEGPLHGFLRLVSMGITFLRVFPVFPQCCGGPRGAAPPPPPDTVGGTPAPKPTPAPDTSAKTQYWNQFLVHPLEAGLRFLATDMGLGAGTAVILFTIAVRAVLLPLSIQQMRSQKSMQRLQPELKALQKRLANDKEKLS